MNNSKEKKTKRKFEVKKYPRVGNGREEHDVDVCTEVESGVTSEHLDIDIECREWLR